MPISSYAIRCASENRRTVINHLHTLAGVTVGSETSNGIPVVVSSSNAREARESGELLDAIIDALVEALVELAAHVEDNGGLEFGRLGRADREDRGGGDKPAFHD